ncbi:MAG: 3-hydroxybutyrate dehydrogenase [Magnetospirillum sp.]|nr:3-hydroxybutyrate dehydrogenase [Magnetospirillum sp.]
MFNGKAALISGSTSGIGLGIARALAAKGVSIMLNGFGDAAEIETMRADLEREFGVRVLYNGADLAQSDGAGALVRDAEARLGRLDILVNNAGIQHVAAVEDFPLERWDAVIALNLTAVFQGIRAALPGMKARGWGRIINIASAHGQVASINKSAYVASKHGVLGLTKVVGLETAELDITCNAICPGWVLTPLVQKQIDARAQAQGVPVEQAGRDLLAEKQPSKAFTTPEQIGELAVFLCSGAAANMTGGSISMDGGWTAQ